MNFLPAIAIAAAQRKLPPDMPSPPSFRKVNPADSPVVHFAPGRIGRKKVGTGGTAAAT